MVDSRHGAYTEFVADDTFHKLEYSYNDVAVVMVDSRHPSTSVITTKADITPSITSLSFVDDLGFIASGSFVKEMEKSLKK